MNIPTTIRPKAKILFGFFDICPTCLGRFCGHLFFLGVMTLLFSQCGVTDKPATLEVTGSKEPRAKNVILLIGDGMGLSYISAGMWANKGKLAMEKFPVVGFHKTWATDDLITDSAAGATAFSCGLKTYRFAIGVDNDSIPCKTILEEAEERQLATGLIATSTIVHATPAAFIAHQKYRVMYEDIAEDFLRTEVDFVVGGGKTYFMNREKDSRNLVQEMIDHGYYVSDNTKEPLAQLAINPKQNFVYFTADKHPNAVTVGRDYLTYATRLACLFLEKHSENGFFLMVEGSQIDWAGHSNDGEWAVQEVLDFDRAVSEAYDYARRRGNTLVIVTADHETGGLAVDDGSTFDKQVYHFNTNMHTGTMVPVFAFGPGAELFSGIYENTTIHDKMRRVLGFDHRAATAVNQPPVVSGNKPE